MLVAGLPANKCKAAQDRSIVSLTNCVVFGNTVENNAISEVLRRLVAFHAVVHTEAAAAVALKHKERAKQPVSRGLDGKTVTDACEQGASSRVVMTANAIEAICSRSQECIVHA